MSEMNEKPTAKHSVPIWVQVLIWSIFVILLGLVAWGLRRAQKGHLQVGDTLPKNQTLTLFEGYEYQGQHVVALDDLRGKVVVLNFWASWCNPCAQEAVDLENAWQKYAPGDEVVFLGVDYVDVEDDAKGYLEEFHITYPNGPDLGTRISQLFHVGGVPETYIFDREGVLRYIKVGPFMSEAEIHQAIQQVLGE